MTIGFDALACIDIFFGQTVSMFSFPHIQRYANGCCINAAIQPG